MIKIRVGDEVEITAAEGDGPVNALDKAVRKALERFYPAIGEIRLTDYKVRVLDSKQASAAKVRVLIESTDHREHWVHHRRIHRRHRRLLARPWWIPSSTS
ncbi:MAG: hypothetical protein M5R42_15130 [Rhodocyclaceae bacterium]|nr:hypothetical protein [Rhodocyclaceae bacterium]